MSKKILVIESDVPLAGTIAGALHARGVEVALARDAQSAIDVARSERPDGIVLSAELTGGSGFVVCNKLRKDPDLRATPVLLTSADATEDTFEQHRRLKTRADAYMRKPFGVADLIRQLGGIAGVPAEPAAAAGDDDVDLLAFDAAFDSIAQAGASAPLEQPVSAEDANAAADLLADLLDGTDADAAVAPAPGAPVPATAERRAEPAPLEAQRDSEAFAVELEPLVIEPDEPPVPLQAAAGVEMDAAQLDALHSRIEALHRDVEAARAELARVTAQRDELQQTLAVEHARIRDVEARLASHTALRAQLHEAIAAAMALLERRD